MSFDRPSLSSLIERSKATLSAKLGSNAPMLERTPEHALCNVSAALADGCHGHLQWLEKQIFPETCDEDLLPVHASAMRLPRKDGESVDEWRARLVAARRDPPSGGDEADFLRWAKSVKGVGRAWVRPGWQGLGTVGVLFAPAGDYDQVQASALRASVQAKLDAMPPLGVERTAIVPDAFDFSIEIAISPNTDAVQQRVVAAVREHLRELAPGELVVLSKLDGTIASINELLDHDIYQPAASVAVPPLSLPVLGDVVFHDF